MIQEILMENRNGRIAVKRSSNNSHRGAARAAFDRKFPNAREAAQIDKAQIIEDMLSKTRWLVRSPLYTTKPTGVVFICLLFNCYALCLVMYYLLDVCPLVIETGLSIHCIGGRGHRTSSATVGFTPSCPEYQNELEQT